MFSDPFSQFFERILFEAFGKEMEILSIEFLNGGCINIAAKITTPSGNYFVKWNESNDSSAFEKESIGLQRIASTKSIDTPEIIKFGTIEGKSYLLLEYIDPVEPTFGFWENFGRKLALLHQNTESNFGFEVDNFIGSLDQINTPNPNWIDFFIEHRLMAQAGLAYYNQLASKELLHRLEKLSYQLPQLLVHQAPSLIHGDLWSGNFISATGGNVFLIDPAVYYANREIEIAFTQLFGGFDPRFYQSYFEAYPVEKGFESRAEIYTLYPLLVHVNLFGTSYLSAVERINERRSFGAITISYWQI
ncbi:MAG: fructosamine kinase family protein [Cytophagales bacterium]|nr:fructosamine kinase family protein [Cytophagales bacterium]